AGRSAVMSPRVTVDLDGAAIACSDHGAGDAVVLVPGLGLDASYFGELGARLADAGFRAIAVNPRGANGSTGTLESQTMRPIAADVAGVIEGLRVRPATVVGHGFGNRIVRCLVTDRPDLVRRIVLLAGAGDLDPTAEVVRLLRSWARPDATES